LAHALGIDRSSAIHHVSRLPLRRYQVRLPWEQVVLPIAVRRAGVDVFHFLDHVMSFAPPAPRTVVTIHEAATIRMPETFGPVRGRWKRMMARRSAQHASRVIANTEFTRRDLQELAGAPPERTRVVYYGLQPNLRREHDPDVLRTVRERYGLPERFFVYVGTIEPRKNVDRIIQAYALARQRDGVNIPLVLAGQKGWFFEGTVALPTKLGIAEHVIFTDYVSPADLPAVYSQTEALVFPTLYEGFGLPVLEAMACGAPVITSNVSSLPEVAGDAGILVDPLSVEEIATALGRVSSDSALRARLATDGPKRARTFTWERAARETVAVYEEAFA
jgi:glycosyltransferase involved in cell wall biosynthesis